MRASAVAGAAIALACGVALAGVTSTTTTSPFDFYVGASKVAVYDDLADCIAAAEANALENERSRTYRCLQTTRVAVDYIAPVVPDPEPDEHDGHPTWPHPEPLPRDTSRSFDSIRIQSTRDHGTPSYDGAFRIPCTYSHMNFDDPIMVPNQPGAFHLHQFFGNTSTDAFTTTESLDAGNSTCAGGTANRTAYWTPAMINAAGIALKPDDVLWYYKGSGDSQYSADIQPLPRGLRMVTGKDHRASAPDPEWIWAQREMFQCRDGGDETPSETIPVCPAGSMLEMHLEFPPCWDGVNLDSADHRSHMARIERGVCPASHPVHIPILSFHIGYRVPAGQTSAGWRLSSDNYSRDLPGGYSWHGDVWFNWDEEVMGRWLDNCVRANKDCAGFLLGDGGEVY